MRELLTPFLIASLIVICILCLVISLKIPKNSQSIESVKVVDTPKNFVLDYDRSGGAIFHPGTEKMQFLDRPEKGTVLYCKYDKEIGKYWIYPIKINEIDNKKALEAMKTGKWLHIDKYIDSPTNARYIGAVMIYDEIFVQLPD
jgi:hypothetical protein